MKPWYVGLVIIVSSSALGDPCASAIAENPLGATIAFRKYTMGKEETPFDPFDEILRTIRDDVRQRKSRLALELVDPWSSRLQRLYQDNPQTKSYSSRKELIKEVHRYVLRWLHTVDELFADQFPDYTPLGTRNRDRGVLDLLNDEGYLLFWTTDADAESLLKIRTTETIPIAVQLPPQNPSHEGALIFQKSLSRSIPRAEETASHQKFFRDLGDPVVTLHSQAESTRKAIATYLEELVKTLPVASKTCERMVLHMVFKQGIPFHLPILIKYLDQNPWNELLPPRTPEIARAKSFLAQKLRTLLVEQNKGYAEGYRADGTPVHITAVFPRNLNEGFQMTVQETGMITEVREHEFQLSSGNTYRFDELISVLLVPREREN